MQRRRDLYLTRYECRRCGTIIYEFRPPIQFSRCGNCPRRLRILSTDGYVPRTGMEQFGTSESSKHLLKLISISLIFSKFICRTLNGAENSKSMNEAQTFTPFKNTQKHWGQCIGSLKSLKRKNHQVDWMLYLCFENSITQTFLSLKCLFNHRLQYWQ